MKTTKNRFLNRLIPPGTGRFCAAAVFLLFLCSACSNNETQRNENPLLASNWGGTGGGPIQGRLEVHVFDDATHFPFGGAIVSLGDSGEVTAQTDPNGIAVFEGVRGPQDIHVFGCSGCNGENEFPIPYQGSSFYQVNASHISIPLFPRDPTISNGTLQGKVFDVGESDLAFVAAIDEIGTFVLNTPLQSTTYYLLNEESPLTPEMTFVFSSSLDVWAAADPAAGKQAFGTVALLGTAINPSGQPQGGVRIEANYFNGTPAGRAYYFNDAGGVDPALTATSADGRFVFLRLLPRNDLFISAKSLGAGVGARFIRLPTNGTVVFKLPVSLATDSSVDLSGRVVGWRSDFREEERKGPFAGKNFGVEGGLINLSGETFEQIVAADHGPGIDGNYRIEGRILPNGRYVAVVLSSGGYRSTYQEFITSNRSKFNYPLTAVPLNDLSGILRDVRIPDAPDENGNPRFRTGLLPGHGEILGRVVEPTGAVDGNGDPVVQPVKDVTLSVTNEAGDDVKKVDPEGNKLENIFYLNPDGTVYVTPEGTINLNPDGTMKLNPDGTMNRILSKTSEGGGFVIFDLPVSGGSSVYTVVARDANGKELARRTVTVYTDSARLLELEIKGETSRPAPLILSPDGNPVGGVSLSLVGGKLCESECLSGSNGEAPVSLPKTGEYFIGMKRRSGGGDYGIPFPGSKRRLGLAAFRIAGEEVDNANFGGGLGPLSPGRNLTLDIGFNVGAALSVTAGQISLPSSFTGNVSTNVLLGAVGPLGMSFIGADPGSVGAATQYRAVSLQAQQALSYFVLGYAQSPTGETSRVMVQGIPAIPEVQNLTFGAPPTSLAPNGATGIGKTPRLSWGLPGDGPADLYRISVQNDSGVRLWQAWVPGGIQAVTSPRLPTIPPGSSAVLQELFTEGEKVSWRVRAVRAPGFTFNEFTLKDLAGRISSDAMAVSEFVP